MHERFSLVGIEKARDRRTQAAFKGKDFDKMYIQKVGVEGQQKAVAAYQK